MPCFYKESGLWRMEKSKNLILSIAFILVNGLHLVANLTLCSLPS